MKTAGKAIEDAQRRIAALESVNTIRISALAKERGGDHIVSAVRWIHDNQSRFRGRVYDPIQLSVGCRDLKFAAQLEACVNQATMRARRPESAAELTVQTILCEREEDYHLLSRELSSRLRINVATLTALHALDKFPPPFDRAEVTDRPGSGTDAVQLTRLGFECFALDQVDAPDAIKGYLCKVSNLHRIVRRPVPRVADRCSQSRVTRPPSSITPASSRPVRRSAAT